MEKKVEYLFKRIKIASNIVQTKLDPQICQGLNER